MRAGIFFHFSMWNNVDETHMDGQINHLFLTPT